MSLEKKELLKLANLAKLELSTEELDNFHRQLGDILDYVDQIKHLNLSTIEASLSGVTEDEQLLRADEVLPSTPEIINQASGLEGNLAVAPGVFKK